MRRLVASAKDAKPRAPRIVGRGGGGVVAAAKDGANRFAVEFFADDAAKEALLRERKSSSEAIDFGHVSLYENRSI